MDGNVVITPLPILLQNKRNPFSDLGSNIYSEGNYMKQEKVKQICSDSKDLYALTTLGRIYVLRSTWASTGKHAKVWKKVIPPVTKGDFTVD